MITINKDRTAYIPESDRHIGFENDNLVETRYFEITDEDTADFSFKLDMAESLDIIDLEKITLEDGKCVLVWKITASAIGDGGIIRAQLRAFDMTGEKVWHSQIMEFAADASVNAEKQIDDTRTLSEFEQLEVRVTNAVNNAASHATEADSAKKEAVDAAESASESKNAAKSYMDEAHSFCDASAVNAGKAENALEEIEAIFGNEDNVIGEAHEHYANQNNPHRVTASQLGSYTKDEANEFFINKAEFQGMYEDSPFVMTDFKYSLNNDTCDYSDYVGENYITSPFTHTITIHCKGKTLSFSASAGNSYDFSYAKMKVNGEYVIDNTSGLVLCKLEDTFMEEDIVCELMSDSISFADMTSKEVNGYGELKNRIGDIDVALDEIIALQEAFAPTVFLPGEEDFPETE